MFNLFSRFHRLSLNRFLFFFFMSFHADRKHPQVKHVKEAIITIQMTSLMMTQKTLAKEKVRRIVWLFFLFCFCSFTVFSWFVLLCFFSKKKTEVFHFRFVPFESTDYCWWPWIWFSAAKPIHRNIKPVFCGCVRKTMGRKGTLNRNTFHCFSHAVYRSRWHIKKNRGAKQKKETYRNEQLVAVWWNRCVSIIIYLWKWHFFSFLFFHFQLIVCNYAFGFWAFLLLRIVINKTHYRFGGCARDEATHSTGNANKETEQRKMCCK